MKGELKRALLTKSNIILIVFVITLMLVNAYYSGWNTSLLINNADDLLNSEDVIFFQKYFGNVYRVWSKSYYMIQALAPLILVAPYLTSYTLEKNNHYRYFMISRKGLLKYNFHKLFAVALSGTIILGGAELLFGIITYFFTHHDTTLEFLKEIVFF